MFSFLSEIKKGSFLNEPFLFCVSENIQNKKICFYVL